MGLERRNLKDPESVSWVQVRARRKEPSTVGKQSLKRAKTQSLSAVVGMATVGNGPQRLVPVWETEFARIQPPQSEILRNSPKFSPVSRRFLHTVKLNSRPVISVEWHSGTS